MNILLNPLYWAIAAAALMVAEVIIPGGIVFFLGGGCLIVAASIWAGLVSTWVGAMTLFFISSLLLIFGLRSMFSRFAEGDFSRANTVEILDEIDHEVAVTETIGPGQQAGKVYFRGTHWKALGGGEMIAAGSKARIVSRETTALIVEAIPVAQESMDENQAKPV
ncbi:MAG: NfeD family protein [Pseudomonadales bacterium]|nr:NfeD family protein [Pseudomonadales bacterium]